MTPPFHALRPVLSAPYSRRALLMQAAAAGLAIPAFAALGASGIRAADSLATSLHDLLAAAVAGGLPGVALAVDRSGASLYAGVAGLASIEQSAPLQPTGRHRIYSIAKTFTAVVTLQLVDEDVLSLDDTVTRWLDDPAVARIPNTERVTLRQLLNHTSGIFDFADDAESPFWADAYLGPDADWTKVWTRAQLLAYADGANHPPYFAPGEGYHYSNTNYILVGLIIEAATGRAYRDELQTRILEPLGLADTFLVEGATMPAGTVDVYHRIDGELVNVTVGNLSWDWTAGGMVSTTADLARFARHVFSGDLLSPASFAAMCTFVPMDRPGLEEGLGVYRAQSPNGELVGMDGAGPGAVSSLMHLASADLTVVVVANMAPDEGATDRLRDETIKAVLGAA